MHGLSYAEIDLVMRAAKKQLDNPKDLIFAKTTDNSLKMKVADLIEDLSEDHNYLKENPPEELTTGSPGTPEN
jgi:Txe/YoeB family toxin of Txe-Axe toxin-antitoxin module